MTKYRKKPVVIDAEQWRPGLLEDVVKPVVCSKVDGAILYPYKPGMGLGEDERVGFGLQTLEGWYVVQANDWIITGINGERYLCKPDIFAATYEAA